MSEEDQMKFRFGITAAIVAAAAVLTMGATPTASAAKKKVPFGQVTLATASGVAPGRINVVATKGKFPQNFNLGIGELGDAEQKLDLPVGAALTVTWEDGVPATVNRVVGTEPITIELPTKGSITDPTPNLAECLDCALVRFEYLGDGTNPITKIVMQGMSGTSTGRVLAQAMYPGDTLSVELPAGSYRVRTFDRLGQLGNSGAAPIIWEPRKTYRISATDPAVPTSAEE